MKLKYAALSISFLCLCTLQGATIQNGDFATGDLTGWTKSGNVFPAANPTTGLVNVLPDSTLWGGFTNFPLPGVLSGGNYAEISNGVGGVNLVPIQDFSMLTTGLYFVTPGGGGTISFLYNLLTDEFPTGADYGKFSVLDASNQELSSTLYPISAIDQNGGCTEVAAPDGTTICAASGWIQQTFSLAAFEGQNVKFAFSVWDAASSDTPDNSIDSALLLANVQATGLDVPGRNLPEPATFVLGGSALLAFSLLRRRAHR